MNKKTTVLILIILIALSTTIFATHARMSGLGSLYGFIEGDTDVFTYPATIFKYSGTVVGELQQSTDSADWIMSANIPLLEYKLGVYLNQNTGMINRDYFPYPANTHWELDISKRVEFNFGFMDKFAVGFGTSIDYKPKKEYITEDGSLLKIDPTANYYTLFGGYSAYNLDIGLKFNIANAENVIDDNELLDADDQFFKMDHFAFKIDGRYIYEPNPNLELVFKAGLFREMSKFEYKELSSLKVKDLEYTNMLINFGISLQIKPNDRNKIILGYAPIIRRTVSDEAWDNTSIYMSEGYYIPERYLAIESQVNSWLTGRFGAKRARVPLQDEGQPSFSVFKIFKKEYQMNLGLSFNFGQFTIDTVLEQELLFDGPNFLGGKSNGLASEVSVKYKF